VIAPPIDFRNLILGLDGPPTHIAQRPNYGFPARPRRIVRQNQPRQRLLPSESIVVPEHHEDSRRADVFAGMEQQVRGFHARFDRYRFRRMA